jgi:hypothetical protein
LWYAGPESPPRWSAEVIDDSGDTGLYCDIAIDSLGDEHVVYHRSDQGALMVISKLSGVWQLPGIVDSSGTVAGHCGIAVEAGGATKVSYRRDDTGALWYAGPEMPPRWLVGVMYDTPGDAGRFVSAVRAPDNRICSAFYRYDSRAPNSVCMAVYDAGVIGAARIVAESVADSQDDAVHVGLAVSYDGRWHISYRNALEPALYYASADTVVTGIEDSEDSPPEYRLTFKLYQNYPNPFNPVTTIRYELDDRVPVILDIYDVQGRLIKRIVNAVQGPGKFSEKWYGKNKFGMQVSSGIYFCRLKSRGDILTKKIVLLR